ncbi:hypothetical protein MBLNU459_g3629t1 [Dothideomycetes sp. NU459]
MALQISIPTTSVAPGDNKPYTLYHVQLALPVRNHETKKRYSDFVALHDALVAQTAQPPPNALPAKSWFRRTVGNEAYTEARRRELEAYLRAVVTAPDGRWRASSAWRAFLDLPSSGGAAAAAAKDGGPPRAAEGAIADPAVWLDVHRAVRTQIHAARQLLQRREAAQTAQEQHAVSADAKASLVRAAAGVARLDTSLGLLAKSRGSDAGGWGSGGGSLGEGEIRRRRDMLGQARMEIEGVEAGLRALVVKSSGSMLNGASGGAAATESDKEGLWRGTSAPHRAGRVLGGPSAKETERTRELDNDGVLGLQKQIMVDQEQDVLEIGKAVSRMKEMGIMINEELVVQNQMLGLVDQDVDRVQGKIDVAKKRISKIR